MKEIWKNKKIVSDKYLALKLSRHRFRLKLPLPALQEKRVHSGFFVAIFNKKHLKWSRGNSVILGV